MTKSAYRVGEIVWAKFQDLPWWPSEIERILNMKHGQLLRVRCLGTTRSLTLRDCNVDPYVRLYDERIRDPAPDLKAAILEANKRSLSSFFIIEADSEHGPEDQKAQTGDSEEAAPAQQETTEKIQAIKQKDKDKDKDKDKEDCEESSVGSDKQNSEERSEESAKPVRIKKAIRKAKRHARARRIGERAARATKVCCITRQASRKRIKKQEKTNEQPMAFVILPLPIASRKSTIRQTKAKTQTPISCVIQPPIANSARFNACVASLLETLLPSQAGTANC